MNGCMGSMDRMILLTTLGVGLVLTGGCGGETSSTGSAPEATAARGAIPIDGERAVTPPVAAINSEVVNPEEVSAVPQPDKGTPEWFLREIARVRTQLSVRSGSAGEATPAELTDQRRKQHEKVIELARQAIAVTHQDDTKVQVFNNAVHYLTDARLELAMSGDTEQAQLLVEDAESLYRRDPKSFAASESAYKLVDLAQRKAEQQGRQNPEWCTELAHQARLFAEKFPQEANRSAMVLLTAGQLCDRFGLTEDARRCFAMVQEQFPDTLFAEQVNGFLRRLSLVGQPLELAGPTIDGGYVSIDQFQDQPVLVVFWSSKSPQFRQDLDQLLVLQQTYAPKGLKAIGVNLDTDESDVDRFLAETSLNWSQIFYSEPDKRGGRNPAARYYGVQSVPTYWLIDISGIVVATPETLDQLAAEMQALSEKI